MTRGQVLTYGGVADRRLLLLDLRRPHRRRRRGVPRGATDPTFARSRTWIRDGAAYCSISPRFRWREEWTGDALRTTLRRTLPADARCAAADARERGAGRLGRPAHGVGPGGSARHRAAGRRRDGGGARRTAGAHVPASGELLRSNAFTLTASRAAGEITRLVAEGGGAGHGVGLLPVGSRGPLARRPGLPAHPRGVLSRRDARALSTEEGRMTGSRTSERAAQGRDHRRRAPSPRSPICRCSRSSR